jgi:hypothetical protein
MAKPAEICALLTASLKACFSGGLGSLQAPWTLACYSMSPVSKERHRSLLLEIGSGM